MKKRRLTLHGLVALLLGVAVLIIYLIGRRARLPYADEMEAAADLQRQAVAAVRAERLQRGYDLVEEDRLGLGLMGVQVSPITTSLSTEEVKRTAQLSDFAALCVRYLHEAGVQRGDRIGACFSASFPGIDLGVLCAAEVMGLKITYSVSIGASNYGANLPGYVLPEMILTAHEAGLLSTLPDLITMGGGGDAGKNMMAYALEEEEDIAAVEAMQERLAAEGLTITWYEEGYEADVLDRMERLGDVAAFVNVGGNILGMGVNDASLSFGQGLLPESDPRITAKSGLIERYLSLGVPTIHFLNIKQLCAETGIPFDPVAEPAVGTSGVYYSRRYSRPAIAASLLLALAATACIEVRSRRKVPH
ncbi:MAG: poly-gamma-glutamate system protein [Clostridia bacterium]|nr:poly-gamma-glutamate system protein [Clostridia bacterium]